VSLPARVRVRISSEAAGQIALTPVIVQEMPVEDLIAILAGPIGPNAARIRDRLARGTIVEGASRFRWEPIYTDDASVQAVLSRLPGPEPSRRFDAARCFQARFRGPNGTFELSKELASRKRLLSRRTFWSALMDRIPALSPEYIGYSHRRRADEYRIYLSRSDVSQMIEEARKLAGQSLADRLQRVEFETVELSVQR
jgi:hypothetical protein